MLAKAQRIVIKVGSLLLMDAKHGRVRSQWLQSLASDIAELRQSGKEVLIVSSGAVALGRQSLGVQRQELSLAEKQAAAACGQIFLTEAWRQALLPHRLEVGQLLLTAEDTQNRRRYLNARATIRTLLDCGVVPVINENDTVTTSEIRYGDNDRLAAHAAAMSGADVCVLLSNIDGLYSADPKKDAQATLVQHVHEITEDIRAMAGESGDLHSSGGMVTKLQAAEIAMRAGCHLVIAQGMGEHPINKLLQGGEATWFIAHEDPLSARKHWIGNAVHLRGTVTVDSGAVNALKQGKSLLPAGVIAVEGEFKRGDTVRIVDQQGHEIARGLTAYHHHEARQICGKQSAQIEATLGYKGRDVLIHRDDMVMM